MSMSLDKVEELKRRFEEALEFVERKDAVQAAEKLYKVAENAVKILSQINKLQEYEEAKRAGTWWTKLLDRTARKLRRYLWRGATRCLGNGIRASPKGFHEEQLTVEEILEKAYKIEVLIKIVEMEVKKTA